MARKNAGRITPNTAPIGETVKASIGMKSDGEMVLMKDDKDANNNGGN